ncbi:MAG: transglycosylase SLT domain-containing protein [bacterium]|nr:transglycosylase SLT domain-containing protein [bacterium]
MMKLNKKQKEVCAKIEIIAQLAGIDPTWAQAVAMTESSLGLHQKSPTDARGVFQMTPIAMKDLLLEMEKSDSDDEFIDIVCGVAFLRVLLNRWGSIDDATMHYCDPLDRHFYVKRVADYIKQLKEIEK